MKSSDNLTRIPSGSDSAQLAEASGEDLANAIRMLSADAVEAANSGHPGLPMGFADVATVLWRDFLRFSPLNPQWPNRDRFVLSAGHGSMLLYALLYLTGYKEAELEQIKAFRRLGSKTPGHPEYGMLPGVETTTGPLGQGLANAVGMAIAEAKGHAQAPDTIDYYTYVAVGDGCLMEGISYEATALAGHLALGKLICLFDDNKITIDGGTELASSSNIPRRFAAENWHTLTVDGHDQAAIATAIKAAKTDPRPSLIACQTTIGFGAPNKGGTAAIHGSPLGADELAAVRKQLNWPYAPFIVPKPILTAWREIGKRGDLAYQRWQQQLDSAAKQLLAELNPFAAPTAATNALKQLTAKTAASNSAINSASSLATRKASEIALTAIVPHYPNLIGGSADLTGSNNTLVAGQDKLSASQPQGNYLHYGIREHAMAAIMNGISLAGLRPYAGTFLTFSDYLRPALRLAALMRLPNIYVFTHDSIGLGEDGPTHQPIEQLASLRAIPDLQVLRPCDIIETLECWQVALEAKLPSLLALSRQAVPCLRSNASENWCRRGGYLLQQAATAKAQFDLIATGSEVYQAKLAADKLKASNISCNVISMPCVELWRNQSPEYRASTLTARRRIIIEAGIQQPWDFLLRPQDHFIGMQQFGASGKCEHLYHHFRISSQHIVTAAKNML